VGGSTPTGFSANLCRVPCLAKDNLRWRQEQPRPPGGRGRGGRAVEPSFVYGPTEYHPWDKPRVTISGHVTSQRHARGLQGLVETAIGKSWPHAPS